ncbi:MAG TPA: glycosyltransferase family A protein [Candidatus Udaeobacter sp.]|nr:glycosyltransferase family A protein [Candidatus Udaeobacter sp.]
MITTRNRGEELRRTLSKLQQLRPQPNEILICADGCTDGTSEIVQSEFPNCTLIENETARGSVFSRDRLLRLAKSSIVLSLDDDSYPIDRDFFVQLESIFTEQANAAVISFPEIRNRDEFAHPIKSPLSAAHLISAYANCAAAMRRDVYLRSQGFPLFFEHMYEEPDFALQCYGLGYEVWFRPSPAIRHHVTPVQRNELRRHHLNARNELWSVLMRCPFPQVIPVALFRVWRQFRYACTEGIVWAIQEPRWWLSAALGTPRCLRCRQPIPWRTYYGWMKLARQPLPRTSNSSPTGGAI